MVFDKLSAIEIVALDAAVVGEKEGVERVVVVGE